MKEAKPAKAEEEEGGIIEWVKGAAIAVVIAVAILQFIKPTIVQQRSMEPNFETNDYLFISKQSYKLFHGEPKLGDVIVFSTEMKTAEGDNKLLIKRVIGVPGDEISIYGGKVYLNGEELDDSYTKEQTTTGDIDRLVVPSDTVFCLGDNRRISVDSRDDSVGLISYDDILGKVIFRLLPLNKIGLIDNPYDGD
ncbi:MAG: signal peptidase I [Firmicutes bacterium]|nr:signal peptidase I [Bacillota bacterium]